MNLHEFIINSIRQSTLQVFSTMLGVEIAPLGFTLEEGVPNGNDGVVSFIGLAGTWAGTGSVTCSPALACRICASMLMTESSSVNEEVLDAVAELTNMIIGSVKTDLETQTGPLGLSIPTVVFGKNFKTKSAGHAEWIVMPFQWDDEVLTVKLCLTQREKAAPLINHSMGHFCTLDV
jgi:chemotaxis protein CheX